MSFSLNGISANPPAGSIAPYLGTNNPPGWVICDGVTQGNGGDGRYNNLIYMGIGLGNYNGNYTPPNFKGAFLRGTGTSSINGAYVGPNLKTAQDMASLAHTHTGDSHKHNTVSGGTACYAVPSGGNNDVTTTGVDGTWNQVNLRNSGLDLKTANTSTSQSSMTNTSVTTTTNNSDTSPYCYGVNWIIKL
jgi:hypothetical protein